jgi:hypothetical protein
MRRVNKKLIAFGGVRFLTCCVYIYTAAQKTRRQELINFVWVIRYKDLERLTFTAQKIY